MVTPCDRSCRGQSCCGCCGSPPGLHQTGTLWQPYDEGCCHRTQKDQPLACMHLQGRLRREWMQGIEEGDTDDGTDKQHIPEDIDDAWRAVIVCLLCGSALAAVRWTFYKWERLIRMHDGIMILFEYRDHRDEFLAWREEQKK